MRKTREVLRLHYELKLRQRQIARSCGLGQSTVHDCLKRAAAAGLNWPLPTEWDEERLEEALYGTPREVPARQKESGRTSPRFTTNCKRTRT